MRTNSNDSKEIYETEPDPDKPNDQEEHGNKENWKIRKRRGKMRLGRPKNRRRALFGTVSKKEKNLMAVQDYISAENEEITTLLIDRLNKIRKKRPILVANTVEIINEKSNGG
jgi:hypothetical protein